MNELVDARDARLAEPDMTEVQILQWIQVCNHEPARRVLRRYLGMMKDRPDLAKRPVAWRVKEAADRWAVYQDEATAIADSDLDGAEMQGLYIRNGL